MIREGHDDVRFFLGREVEHTPAFGMQTLFVVGLQTIADIRARITEANDFTDSNRHIQHVYFGANQSFPYLVYNDADGWSAWEEMIMPFLEDGYWCTLDLDVNSMLGLTDGTLVEQDRFIPMISVKLPYIRALGYNAVLKLDDTDFQHSNPGVWCHNVHDLLNRDKFTDWSKYTKDEIVK